MDSDQIVRCNIFNKDKQEELFQFLHACINEICFNTEPTYRQYSNIDWTKEEFDSVHKYVSTLFQNPICLYINEEKMPLEYHELPEHVRQAILVCLRVRRNELTDALMIKYSSKHIPTVVDFDWRLRYVMGSSKMASIREPLVQLNIITLQHDQKTENLELEFNKDELELLINKLKSINS